MTKYDTVTLPAYWATALVNNDWSGLDADEAAMCRAAIARLAADGQRVVSTADDAEPRFTWHYGLYCPEATCSGGDVLDYIVHREAEPITPVIFRRMNKGHGGEIIAVFPTDAASMKAHECGCYVHVGQHSACDPWHIIRHSKAATPAEYADLKAELEGEPYGYRFKVYTRLQRRWHEDRAAELRKQGGAKIPKCGCDEREEIVNRHSRSEG